MRVWAQTGVVLVACVLGGSAAAQPQPACRIVFEGDTGGVSSGGALRSLAAVIFRDAVDAGAQVKILESDLGALYDHGRYLLPAGEGGRLSDVLAVLDGSPLERVATTEVRVLRDRYSVNLIDPFTALEGEAPSQRLGALLEAEGATPGAAPDVVEERWRFSLVANQAGRQALLLESPQADPERELAQPRQVWEVRFRYDVAMRWPDGTEARILTAERRIGEGSRRIRWVEEQLAGLPEASLFVSAGNAVEGRSWIEGQLLNLQRPTSWDALRDAGLAVLVPAENELAGGVANLRDEATVAGVGLVSANLFAEGGEVPLFAGSEVRELGSLRVAFVGLTDPDAVDALPPSVMEELDVGDPATALRTELERLGQDPQGLPDLVVLLSVMDQAKLDRLLERVTGVDVVIGPGSRVSQRDAVTEVFLPPGSAPSELDRTARSPLTRILTGPEVVGRIDVFTAGTTTIARAEVTRRVVDQSWRPLSPFVDRVNQVRHDVYTAGEAVLFPDLNTFLREHPELLAVYVRHANIPPGIEPEDFLERYPVVLSRGLWLTYLANTLRAWTDADVAMVRVLPMPFLLSGPIPAVLIDSAVGVLDEVVVYHVGGADLVDLLDLRNSLRRYPERMLDNDPPPAMSGVSWEYDADEDEEVFIVGGREIDPEATYIVAMTDHLAAQPDYAELLAGNEPERLFEPDDAEHELDADSDGAPAPLHALAVRDLTLRAEAHPDFGPQYVAGLVPALEYQGDDLVPELQLRIHHLDLSLQQVSHRGDRTGYGEVRNTRVTQPDSFAIDYQGAFDLVFDLVPVILTFGFQSQYGQLELASEKSETADDLVGLVDLQYRLSDGTALARSVRPYVTSRLDTEFTPVEVVDDAGVTRELARQLLSRNSAGIRFDFNDFVPELRLGAFAEVDLAADQGGTSFGGELSFRQELDVEDVIEESLELAALYYIPSDQDGLDDLRFSVGSRLGLAVPLLGGLRVTTFIDAFVFQGTQPTNDNVGASLIFGAGVGYAEVFRWTL